MTISYASEGEDISTPFAIVADNCDAEAGYTVEETILVNTASEFTVERLYTAFDAWKHDHLHADGHVDHHCQRLYRPRGVQLR